MNTRKTAHLKFRTLTSTRHVPARTPEERRAKLKQWKSLRDYGIRGEALVKKTGLEPKVARQWAQELDFDLGRHA